MKKQLKTLYISDKKIQKAISKPIPKKIIDCFYDTPLTASQIADAVSFPKDKIYYHIKKLLALNILFVSETKEIKGIIQKKFLPKSDKIVFGDPPAKTFKSSSKDNKIDETKNDIIDPKKSITPVNAKKEKGHSPEKTELVPEKEIVTPVDDPNRVASTGKTSSMRSINDRRKSRDRRGDHSRRSNLKRRVKQFFDYTSPDRRSHNHRRTLEDRRIINNRRHKTDRRLEGEIRTIKRSNQKYVLKKSQPFISSPFLFNSLAHLQGMKKAITFVQSGNSVTYMQAQMGLDDFIIKEIRNYTLPMRIDDHIIQTFPELIRHVYYQTVDTAHSKDYYLAFSSSDYDYQMVYIDTENLEDDIESYITNNIQKSFSIKYDKMIMDWAMNDTNEHNAVVCYSTKIDSIHSDYSALTSFGIQPRYNTSIPQIIYNIYKYSHFGIGGGNALIVYIEKYRTNLILIQSAELVDSQFFTMGLESFVSVINNLFNEPDNQSTGSKLAAARFLQDHGTGPVRTGNSNSNISASKMKTVFDTLQPVVESFKSEVLASFRFFSGVRNKISGRGLVIDNVFIGGSGAHIKNMKEIINDLLNYPVHSLDDLYLGHTKKLTVPKQQKKLARNQKSLLKEQRKASQEIAKVRDKIESNEKELNVYSDLSKLEVERDKLLLDKAHRLKDLGKTEKSLLLAKLKKTKLDDNFTIEKKRLASDLEKISDELESAEKDNLDRYKSADLVSQYSSNLLVQDKSRLVDNEHSVAEIEILIRELRHDKDEIEDDIISLESDIEIINSKILQQEKAIELNVKDHVDISSELAQKRKQADHFSNNPWRSPKTTIDLREVLGKENNDLSGRLKELDISLVTKKPSLEKYDDKVTELIKSLSPLNIELEESVTRYDEQSSRLINTSLEYEKSLNRLSVLEDDYKKTNSIYLENISELEAAIKRLDQDTIVNTIYQAKINLVQLKKEQDKNQRQLSSIEKQFELDLEYDKTAQKNLKKKRQLAEKSFQSTHRKILSTKSILEQNIQDIDHGKGELSVLRYLKNALKTTHDLLEIRFSDDLIELNNIDRSIETSLATAEKSITWSLAQLENNREKFSSQNSEKIKLKKKRNQHEKDELEFVKNILGVMDILLDTPRDLSMLKEKLRALKTISDSRSNYLSKINDIEALIDDIQLKKAHLTKQKTINDRAVKGNTKDIKLNLSELKNKELALEENISSSIDKSKELESLRLLNARDNDTNNEIIKSRTSEIGKIKLEIEQLYLSKKAKTELVSEKRIQETVLVDIVKATEEQIKKIATIEERQLDSNTLHSRKIDELNKKSRELEKSISQLYSEISLEESWHKKSKSRVKEIQNEKKAWKEETIILKHEEKTLRLQATKMRSETISKKEAFQKGFSADIEKIEIEQSAVIQKANEERQTIKQKIFVELDVLQKQENGIQSQLKREVAKLDSISIETKNTEDKIKTEKNRINAELSSITKEANTHQDSRDSLQSDIYKLQKELKRITSKRDRLEGQFSDRVINTAEQVAMLEERIIYKNTDDYLSFVIEGLGRVGSGADQNVTAQQIIAESIDIDTNEVISLKNSLKTFRQSAKEKLMDSSDEIKTIEKELAPYKKQRNSLNRKIRLVNKKIELLNKPLNKLEKKYEKLFEQKQLEEKNFLLFQETVEDELTQINKKRGETEDSGSEEIKTIDASLENSIEKIKLRINDNSNSYKIELHQADEELTSILEKINNRLEKIKIIISAGKKIQEENEAENASILSRRKTASQMISNHRKKIKNSQRDIKKAESLIKIELERYAKYRDKILQQINHTENELISSNTKKEKQEQELSIINSRIVNYDEEIPNVDSDIKRFESQIEELKNNNKSDAANQSVFNNKFFVSEARMTDNIESLTKKRVNIESSISQLKIVLASKKDEQDSLTDAINRIEKNLTDLEMKYKQSTHERHDFVQQIESLTKEANRATSIINSVVIVLIKNEEIRENIVPLIKDRIEGLEGFIKEYNADQKLIKDSLKQLIINQKTKSAALVSVEQEISVVAKKIYAAEKNTQNNKKAIETDFTNKKILIDRTQSDIINLEDKLESVKLQLATLSDQKHSTEKAINESDKDFQNQRLTLDQLRNELEKSKVELNNTLAVLNASVIDLKKRIEPLEMEKRKTNDVIENLRLDIDQISVEIKTLKMNHRDNEKNVKKADKIIASEQQKLRDEEEKIKQSIRDLESKLDNANSYNKEQRKLLEISINENIELEDMLSDKREKKQNVESKISNTEALILDKKKLQKLKYEEKGLTKEINIAENKINHIRENYKSLNEVILETERTYNRDLKPLDSKVSAAELSIIDINTAIRKADKRLLELNQRIRIAPTKIKKLQSLHQKYLRIKDQYDLRLKEADRGLQLIKKKIDIMAKEKTNKDNKDIEMTKDIDHIANIGLLLNPNETLNLLPQQHKIDYWFYMPNRLLQLATILFLFLSTAIGVYQTSYLNIKENTIPDKMQKFSVASSEHKVYEDLLNDIDILNQFKTKMIADETNSDNIISLLKYVSNTVPKEFKVTELRVNEPKYFGDHGNNNPKSNTYADASLSIYVSGFVKMNSLRSKKILSGFQDQVEMSRQFKEIQISEQAGGSKSRTVYAINLLL